MTALRSYIDSLPSKGVREAAADALNLWFNIPQEDLVIIKRVSGLLHSASLMLDDIEDSSALRRGRPSTHTVFGSPQTINSAGHRINEALHEVMTLGSSDCIRIFKGTLYVLKSRIDVVLC